MTDKFPDELSPRFTVKRACKIFGVERLPIDEVAIPQLATFSLPADRWPEREYDDLLEPANDDGSELLEYWRAFRDRPDFPVSPWDATRGYIRLSELPASAESFDPPRWRVLETMATLQGPVEAGGTITALPARPNLSAVEALNRTADLITRYLRKHLISGWTPSELFRNGKPNLPFPCIESVGHSRVGF